MSRFYVKCWDCPDEQGPFRSDAERSGWEFSHTEETGHWRFTHRED